MGRALKFHAHNAAQPDIIEPMPLSFSQRDKPAPADSAPSAWQTSAPGFAVTESSSPASAPLLDPTRTFDVCHVGLVLRTVLGVQAALALGTALLARDAAQWLMLTTNGTVVTMFAALSWLLAVCAGKRLWPRLAEPAQWGMLMAMGAVSALLGFALLNLTSDEPASAWRWGSVAAAGASEIGRAHV